MSEGRYVPFFYGHDWIGEFVSRDLRETADRLRFYAGFLDGKASLLEEQMGLAAKGIDNYAKGKAHKRAQGTEARRAETTGSACDGPVANGDAPKGEGQ